MWDTFSHTKKHLLHRLTDRGSDGALAVSSQVAFPYGHSVEALHWPHGRSITFLVFDDDTAVGCQYSSPLWMGDTCGRESQCGDLHMT